MMRRLTVAALGLAITLSIVAQSPAQVYYSNDFDNPAVVGPGVAASISGGTIVPTISPYDTTFGNIYRGDSNVTPISLQLSNLPTHSGVDIDFVLTFLDSWDSYDGSCCTPDNMDIYIDGNLTATLTYNNATGTIKDIDSGTLLYEYVQFDGNGFYSDTVVDMSSDPTYTFPHSASTLTFELIASGNGWQGGGDEGYAIDNLSVTLSGVVPEPTSCAILAMSLVGFGLRRR